MKTSRSRELLNEVDDFLTHIESFLHGSDGDKVTELRAKVSDFLSTLKDTEESLPVPSQGEAERAISFAEWAGINRWLYNKTEKLWFKSTVKAPLQATSTELYDLYLTTQSTAK